MSQMMIKSPSPGAFIFVINIDGVGESFTMPTPNWNDAFTIHPVYDYYVSWGDGSPEDHITAYNQAEATHDYTGKSGDFTIRVRGRMEIFRSTGGFANDLMVVDFLQWGDVGLIELIGTFDSMRYMSYSATDSPIVLGRGITSLKNMFYYTGPQGFDPNDFGTFNGDISGWDVSEITDFRYFASECYWNMSLSGWDTSAGTDFDHMFSNNPIFNSPVDHFDVSHCANFHDMFYQCYAFNQPVGSWDVSNATRLLGTFTACTVFNQDISAWTPINVESGNFVGMRFLLTGTAFSTTNYDLLLNAWSLLTFTNSGIRLSLNAAYTITTSQAARNILTSAPNLWNISDGGGI